MVIERLTADLTYEVGRYPCTARYEKLKTSLYLVALLIGAVIESVSVQTGGTIWERSQLLALALLGAR